MNEIPSGYKQTEVGVIPDDWEITTVGDEFSVQLGKMLDSEKNVGVLRPYLGNRAVQWGGIVLDDIGLVRMTPSDLQRFRLRDGDLLVCEGGEIGRAAIWKQPTQECYYQKALHRLRPKRGYHVSLMLNMLQRWAITGFLLNFVTQTSIAHLPKEKFEKVPLPLPPTQAEQETIAEALSDMDAFIESLEQLLTKKRRVKQGAMQELLTGKKRLPGFQVKPGYKQAEIGPIPEDWNVVPMGQVSECLIGLTYSPLDVRDFGTLVLRSSNVQNGRLAFDDNVYVDMEVPPRAITKKDDILICVRNGSRQLIGKCALIDAKTAGSAFGAFMSVLRSDSADFLFFQFQSKTQKQQIDEVMGATINQITNKDMATFKVIWPSTKSERTAIATVLSDMDAEIAALEAKLTKARSLKHGMMHQLLSGQIRLV